MNAVIVRRIAISGLLLAVIACGGSGWWALSHASAPFIAPGAADVRVADIALGERVISYRMPQGQVGWQSTVGRALSVQGWALATDYYSWGDTEKYKTIYTRTSQIWLLRMCAKAQFDGDRTLAIIHIRYEFPCK